jgi:hypothetical protein
MDLATTVEIECPATAAFEVISDFTRNPEWQSGMQSAQWTSKPPLRIGSTYDQQARFLRREVTTSFEVTAYDPGRSITIESPESSFLIRVTRTVEPIGPDRCEVTAHVSGEPGGFFRVFGPLSDRMAARSVRFDYRRLQQMWAGG